MTRFSTISRDTKIMKETWNSKQIAEPVNPRSRRTRANAPAYNEVFKHMANAMEDPFWKDRFMEAVVGVFPPKISYCNGVLQYRGADEATIILQTDVPESDIETLASQYMTVIHFYQTHIQMYSPMDVQQMNALSTNTEMTEESMGCIWSKMKQKQQDLALYELMREERIARNLKRDQCVQMEQTVNIAKQLKYTNVNTIKVNRFRIVSQTFMYYDDEKKIYLITPTLLEPIKLRPQKKKVTKQKPTYYQKWIAFHALMNAKPEDKVQDDDIIRHFRHPAGEEHSTEDSTENESTTFTGVLV